MNIWYRVTDLEAAQAERVAAASDLANAEAEHTAVAEAVARAGNLDERLAEYAALEDRLVHLRTYADVSRKQIVSILSALGTELDELKTATGDLQP